MPTSPQALFGLRPEKKSAAGPIPALMLMRGGLRGCEPAFIVGTKGVVSLSYRLFEFVACRQIREVFANFVGTPEEEVEEQPTPFESENRKRMFEELTSIRAGARSGCFRVRKLLKNPIVSRPLVSYRPMLPILHQV